MYQSPSHESDTYGDAEPPASNKYHEGADWKGMRMRLGITTFNPLVKVAVWTGWFPTPLLSGYWRMMSSRALMAGVRLGIFEELAGSPKSAEEVSDALGLEPVGTEALLNALNGFGFLRRRAGRYSNTRSVRRWLQNDSRYPLTDAFGLFKILWDELDAVEQRLKDPSEREFHADRDEEFWHDYQKGLAQFAGMGSAEIVRRVRFDHQPQRLLDVGGGHAIYTIRFCDRYPGLSAEVIDLPGAVEIGRANVAEAGLEDRISFRAEDLLSSEWGDGFDVVLVFNVIHVFTPEQVAEIFGKAHAALSPGGTLVVFDSAHEGGSGNIDATGGANELLFWVINDTRAYPESDVAGWMRAAGFTDVRTRHLTLVPQAALSQGRRP